MSSHETLDDTGRPIKRPVLQLIRGDATAEEVAAVLAVVLGAAASGRNAPEASEPVSLWGSARHRSTRISPSGRHVDADQLGWRTSFWPR